MKKIDLKKFTSSVALVFDYDRSKVVLRARRDWTILILVTAILLFLFSFFGYWVYAYFLDRGIPESVKSIKLIDVKKLEEVVGTFEAKEVLFRQFYENPPKLTDPY